jgi:CubicO group peptidase (beta-lactamase class C family)
MTRTTNHSVTPAARGVSQRPQTTAVRLYPQFPGYDSSLHLLTITYNPEILAVLLNDGTSPSTGKQLLKKSTVDEMFRNQIPHLPSLTEKPFPDAKPELTNASVGAYPTVEGDRQGWGLSFLISGGNSGRSLSTAHWTGLPNVFWWCDRDQGIAGIVCTQILPFGDRHSFKLWLDVEEGVYKGLERGKL